jgi:hypothetical protein
VIVGMASMNASAQMFPGYPPTNFNPYATNPGVNPFAVNPYSPGINPYSPGVNPYAVNPYAVNPYSMPNPYQANPYSVPNVNPYAVNPYATPNVNPYAVNPYAVNPSPYPVNPVPSTGFAVNNSGVRYSVNVGRFSISSFSNNLSVAPVGGAPAIGPMPGYLAATPQYYPMPNSVVPARASAPAVLDLSGIDLER